VISALDKPELTEPVTPRVAAAVPATSVPVASALISARRPPQLGEATLKLAETEIAIAEVFGKCRAV